MATTLESTGGYWLPSEFFDDSLMEKNDPHPADFRFPTEFPYDTEISPGDRFKEKGRVMSTSPQSTLSHMWGGSSNGSPNGVASPPTAGFNAVGDLIHRAAGQVAKLKLSDDVVTPNLYHAPNPSVFHNLYLEEQKQGAGVWCGGPQQWRNPARIGRSGPRAVLLGGGSAVKRGCAGTGVFLPRRYGDVRHDCNNYSYSSSGHHPSAAFLPQRNGFAPSQPLQFNPGFASEYDLLMARRHALLLQHKRSLLLEGSGLAGRRVVLPREWTY